MNYACTILSSDTESINVIRIQQNEIESHETSYEATIHDCNKISRKAVGLRTGGV